MVFGSKVDQLLGGKRAKKIRVNIYVGKETYEAFQRACKVKGLSASEIVDALMTDFVSRMTNGENNKVLGLDQAPNKQG